VIGDVEWQYYGRNLHGNFTEVWTVGLKKASKAGISHGENQLEINFERG
jgi:hypothetical protein